ncbi:MAG: hypothetical protein FJY07_08960 [Bacteroidetes bacterium]|nr:hypothetical protein [Bacteroidota bacterium]
MKNRILLSLITVITVAFMTSCNKPPQVEIDAATLALSEAKAAGADLYLPDQYNAVQDSMNVAMQIIEAKKSKWFARYGESVKQLEAIKVKSAEVKANTEVRKEEIKKEVEATLAEVNTLLAEDKDLLAKAPRGKENKEVLDAITSELSVLETTATEVSGLLASGDLLAAQSKVNAAKEKAGSIKAELEEAIAKKKGGKK